MNFCGEPAALSQEILLSKLKHRQVTTHFNFLSCRQPKLSSDRDQRADRIYKLNDLLMNLCIVYWW
ncbi:hypothetical protein DEV91_14322 [Phyllobacterium brassicacearum]|nr:hypothetical protein DEV91_14322 [Phyllobacterium brassicacearum]